MVKSKSWLSTVDSNTLETEDGFGVLASLVLDFPMSFLPNATQVAQKRSHGY
jgi:hypothetical protein